MDIFCRGIKPFPPLVLAEVCFWLRIMRDHAVFIDLGLPGTEGELKIEAQRFYAVFADLEERAGAATGEEEFAHLVAVATIAVQRFFVFKRHILHELLACRLCGGGLYPLFVDHLSREALYFRKLLKKCVSGGMPCPVDAVLAENVFWARGIADHVKFVRSLVDPSERALVSLAEVMGCRFDQLSLQARDLASMLWHYRPDNELVRFEKDFRLAVGEANGFAAATERLVVRCTAATAATPLLTDHVRREGEHCLAVLELIRAYLLAGNGETHEEPEDEDDDD
jgi:hypothetical protein